MSPLLQNQPGSRLSSNVFRNRLLCHWSPVLHPPSLPYILKEDLREVSPVYSCLWNRLIRLEQEVASLRKENEALRKKLASVQPVTIERLEYKIQELSIKTLSGTLNVGLSATGDDQSIAGMIEQIQKKGKGPKKKEHPPEKEGYSISIVDDSPAKTGDAAKDGEKAGWNRDPDA
jgi:hypothetical protein